MSSQLFSERTYTLAEIHQISGFLPTSFPGGYSVLDPDYSQYDFEGDPDCLRLVRVDGEDYPEPGESQRNFDRYFCVFYAQHDPRQNRPVAVFDRAHFMMKFVNAFPGLFREENRENDVLTVAEWRKLRYEQ